MFRHQQEDFINLGHVLLSIASNTLSLPHNENIGKEKERSDQSCSELNRLKLGILR